MNFSGEIKDKKLYFEALRILCIWLVLFNHTGVKGFKLFSVSQDSCFFYFYLFLSLADKVAVPIFFMISGALLLPKEENILKLYRKRILKFFVILVIVSVGYCFYNNMHGYRSIVKLIYTKPAEIALWYLYSYLGLLIMLPLLRKMVRNMGEKEYIYMIFWYIVLIGGIPISQYCVGNESLHITREFNVELLWTSSIFYFVIGNYFENVVPEEKLNKKVVFIGLLLSLIAIGICGYMTIYKASIVGMKKAARAESFHWSLLAIPTITTFIAMKYYFLHYKLNENIEKIIAILGSCSFGVYLLERVLRDKTIAIFNYLQPYFGTLAATFAWITCAVALGMIITLMFKQIPFVKDYL